MSFLAPTLLWGLLAATIPIIIHLFSLRRTRTVHFSSIRFIKELEHETIKKLKLRQWLLLILRTLAIVCIVLVFARPVKIGYFPPLGTGSQTVKMVILLDNSVSMSAKYDGESLLNRAKNIVVNILENVEGDINLDIYQTTPLSRHFSGELVSSQDVQDVLNNIEESKGEDNLWQVINNLLRETEFSDESSFHRANREFYLFSDFPQIDPGTVLYESSRDVSEGDGFSKWRFFLFQQPDIVDNVSVSSAEVISQLRLPGQMVDISVQVNNKGKIPRKNIPIQLYFDDDRMGQVVSDLDPMKSKDFLFQAYPKYSGFVHGFIEIPEDDYLLDNQIFFQFAIPPQIRCKVVGQTEDDILLLRYALTSINVDSEFVIVEELFNPNPNTLNLSNTDVLILIDPPQFQQKVLDELEKYMEGGYDLIVFLGEEYAKKSFHSLISSLSFPHARGLVELGGNAFHEVMDIDLDHPIFADFGLKDLEDEMPQVFKHIKLEMNQNDKVLLTLSDGDPLLLEMINPSQSTFIFSILPSLRWSDMPIRGLFVPLLHRMLVYCTTESRFDRTYTVGDSFTIPLDQSVLSKEIEMWKPSGQRSLLVPEYQSEELVMDELDEVGVYDLLAGGKHFFSFVVNISRDEDPANRLSKRQLFDYFPADRTRLVTWQDDPIASVREARRGTELWRLFLLAALVMLAIESWVGRVRKEELRE